MGVRPGVLALSKGYRTWEGGGQVENRAPADRVGKDAGRPFNDPSGTL